MECKKYFCIIVDIDQNDNQLPSHPYNFYYGIILVKGIFATVLNAITFFRIKRISRKLFGNIKDEIPDTVLRRQQQERKFYRTSKRTII